MQMPTISGSFSPRKHIPTRSLGKKYKTKDSFFLIVIDDGSGIDEEGINSVMDFGAPRVYDELELGKFGVGMKSSSLSQAKEITLLSKVAEISNYAAFPQK